MRKKRFNFIKMMLALVVAFAFAFGASTNNTEAATKVETISLTKNKQKTVNRKFNKDQIDIMKVTVPADGLFTMKLDNPKKREMGIALFSEFDPILLEDIENIDESNLDIMDSALMDVEILGYAINSEIFDYDKTMHTFSVGLKKGTYYVLAMNLDEGKNKNYTAKFTLKASSSYEKEANNTIKQATSIKLNKTYNASFNLFDTDDYYKVTVPKSGYLKLNVNQKYKTKFKLKVLDAKKKTVKGLKVTKSNKSYNGSVYLSKGTYYIKVNGDMMDLMDSMSDRVSYTLKTSVKTKTPKKSTVKVINKKGTKNDKVIVSNLQSGSTVKIYADASKKKTLATKTKSGKSATIRLKSLNSKGGKLYITVKKAGISESAAVRVNY
ncbi:hypothetical protein JFL43_04765 [Viridibacillus sp. YIM B01967]|uniref:Uncharacterized protein n=1 Tax=Viridibacillus soli TaxID=2798301 RepID=A0ABS1H440_9BACL|nr:hypothetical protein [Viridibacillus soli]MBK3494179.1 hypothetical protein [Viridibacillus soli]